MNKFCNLCGSPVEENAKFCTVCGARISESQEPNANGFERNGGYQQNAQQFNQQQNYQQVPNGQQSNYSPNVNDKPSVGYNLLSFFIPLAGLIIYLVEKDKAPNRSKSAGKFALIGLAVNVVISILTFVISMFIQVYTFRNVFEVADFPSNSYYSEEFSLPEDEENFPFDEFYYDEFYYDEFQS